MKKLKKLTKADLKKFARRSAKVYDDFWLKMKKEAHFGSKRVKIDIYSPKDGSLGLVFLVGRKGTAHITQATTSDELDRSYKFVLNTLNRMPKTKTARRWFKRAMNIENL